MNIGLFAQTLYTGKGGIERATTRLSAWLSERGHTCTIYCIGLGQGKPQYPLHPSVRTCSLRVDSPAALQRSRAILLRDKLDVFCGAHSTSGRFLFLHLCNNTGIPLLMSERCSPTEVEELFLNRRDRLASFAGADGIHLLSEKYLYSLPDFLRHRATVIPNAAPSVTSIVWEKRDSPRKIILAAARLEERQKRISLLIRAFALLAQRFPDWDCRICGDGYGYTDYKRLINAYGLADRILLPGVVDNMADEYTSASIFCMPSAFEGSPNALLEAQSYGLPSVGFMDCGGVNDIILNGENGFLVETRSPAALASTLARLMENADLRRHCAEGAQRLTVARYDADDIFARWEALLTQVAACRGHTRLNYVPLPEGEEDACLCLRNLLSQDIIKQFGGTWANTIRTLRSRMLLS